MNNALNRILYVEDDESLQEIVRMALQDVGGFTVLTCSSGAEAIAKSPDFGPQLALLDVMMPGMDGPQTLTELSRMPSLANLVAVFITAKVRPAEVARLKDMGAVDVIGKPFDPMTLPERIRAIWNQSGDPAANAAVDAEAPAFQARFRKQAMGTRAPLILARKAILNDDPAAVARALEDVIAIAHRLAGSGGIFGFPAISEMAAELENAAEAARSEPETPAKVLVERIDALLDSLP